jgi:homeobox protein cut-like
LEASLIEKERIIAELHAELHTLETQLSVEREEHLSDLKKLNALMNEKVYSQNFCFSMTLRMGVDI